MASEQVKTVSELVSAQKAIMAELERAQEKEAEKLRTELEQKKDALAREWTDRGRDYARDSDLVENALREYLSLINGPLEVRQKFVEYVHNMTGSHRYDLLDSLRRIRNYNPNETPAEKKVRMLTAVMMDYENIGFNRADRAFRNDMDASIAAYWANEAEKHNGK
jgi:hypothetical protein